MKKQERDDIERLCNLKIADMGDKELTLHYLRKFVNPSANFCLMCGGSVKIMFNQLRNWWNRQNKENYRFIKDKE
jgi:hypothetical protein